MQNIDLMFPNYIDSSNFRYLTIDDKIVASLIVKDLPEKAEFSEIISSLMLEYNYDLSLEVLKQDTRKILKDITYHIASTISEKKTVNSNQVDIDLIDLSKSDAQKLRQEIQLNNEEIFFVKIVITIYQEKIEEIENIFSILKKIESSLYSKQIITKYANFRQLSCYINSIPNSISKKQNGVNNNIFTTSSLANQFCFYSKNAIDDFGILFGKFNGEKEICFIDIFDEKYTNANMCIFGSSGSGKSYFAKLLIIRNSFMGITQYIFDPEGEYVSVAKPIDANVINLTNDESSDRVNIFDIAVEDIKVFGKQFLSQKVNSVINLLKYIIKIDVNDIQILKGAIFKMYYDKGISENIESVYELTDNDMIYVDRKIKNANQMPTLTDLIFSLRVISNSLSSGEIKAQYIRLIKTIEIEIKNVYCFLDGITSVDLSSKTVILNLKKMNVNSQALFVKYFLDKIDLILKSDFKAKSIIYIDEVWKYISNSKHLELSKQICQMYKTIRKTGGAIITITQDIIDFINFENGDFGKSIMNNSAFKIYFKMEYIDSENIYKIGQIDKEILRQICSLSKGNAVLKFANNTSVISIKANDCEKKIINSNRLQEME